MNCYLDLFLTFARIGVCTFGGGYAMLPILERELVEKRGWAKTEELADYYAIGQCTPGVIAVNTATFVGCKRRGAPGGIAATLGLVFPCLVIIVLIASFLDHFADLPVVGHAFAGIRACVCALILSSVLKLRKTTVIDLSTAVLFSVVLLCAVLRAYLPLPVPLHLLFSPAVLVALAGATGVLLRCVRGWKT